MLGKCHRVSPRKEKFRLAKLSEFSHSLRGCRIPSTQLGFQRFGLTIGAAFLSLYSFDLVQLQSRPVVQHF